MGSEYIYKMCHAWLLVICIINKYLIQLKTQHNSFPVTTSVARILQWGVGGWKWHHI